MSKSPINAESRNRPPTQGCEFECFKFPNGGGQDRPSRDRSGFAIGQVNNVPADLGIREVPPVVTITGLIGSDSQLTSPRIGEDLFARPDGYSKTNLDKAI